MTLGHIDIIKRGKSFCDKLIVAIGENSKKTTLIPLQNRIEIIRHTLHKYKISKNIEVDSFDGLLINYAKEIGASVIIRGIRSVSDFEYEINLANVNKVLAPDIESVFLPTSPELAVVSSSMVKEIRKYNGDVSKFVPEDVLKFFNTAKF